MMPLRMDRLHITDLEAALNHWRAVRPAAASGALAPEVAALAAVYGRMVYQPDRVVRPAGRRSPTRAELHPVRT